MEHGITPLPISGQTPIIPSKTPIIDEQQAKQQIISKVAEQKIGTQPQIPDEEILKDRTILHEGKENIASISQAFCRLFQKENLALSMPHDVREQLLQHEETKAFFLQELEKNPTGTIWKGFQNSFFDKIVNGNKDPKATKAIQNALLIYLKDWIQPNSTLQNPDFLNTISNQEMLQELVIEIEKEIQGSASFEQRRKKLDSLIQRLPALSKVAESARQEMQVQTLCNQIQSLKDRNSLTHDECANLLDDLELIQESTPDRMDEIRKLCAQTTIPSLQYFAAFSKSNFEETIDAMIDINDLESLKRPDIRASREGVDLIKNGPQSLHDLYLFFTLRANSADADSFYKKCRQSPQNIIKSLADGFDTITTHGKNAKKPFAQELLYICFKRILARYGQFIQEKDIQKIKEFLLVAPDNSVTEIVLDSMGRDLNPLVRKMAASMTASGKPCTRDTLLAMMDNTLSSILESTDFRAHELEEFLKQSQDPNAAAPAWQRMQSSNDPIIQKIVTDISQGTIPLTTDLLLQNIHNALNGALYSGQFTLQELHESLLLFTDNAKRKFIVDCMRLSAHPLIQKMIQHLPESEEPPSQNLLLRTFRDTLFENLRTGNFTASELHDFLLVVQDDEGRQLAWQEMQKSSDSLIRKIVENIKSAKPAFSFDIFPDILRNTVHDLLLSTNFTVSELQAFLSIYTDQKSLDYAWACMKGAHNHLIENIVEALGSKQPSITRSDLQNAIHNVFESTNLDMHELNAFLIEGGDPKALGAAWQEMEKSQNSLVKDIVKEVGRPVPPITRGIVLDAMQEVFEKTNYSIQDLKEYVTESTDPTALLLAWQRIQYSPNPLAQKIKKNILKTGGVPHITKELLLQCIRETLHETIQTQNFTVNELHEYLMEVSDSATLGTVWQKMQHSNNPLILKIVKEVPGNTPLSRDLLLNTIRETLLTYMHTGKYTIHALKEFLLIYPDPTIRNEAAQNFVNSENALIQEMVKSGVSYAKLGSPRSWLQLIEEVLESRFAEKLNSLCDALSPGKRGEPCFADIENFVTQEMRFDYEWRDEDIKKLSKKIPQNAIDPLVRLLYGKTTRKEFMEAFQLAKASRSQQINNVLASHTDLSRDDIKLLIGMNPDENQTTEIVTKAQKSMPQLKNRIEQMELATKQSFETKPVSTSKLLSAAFYIEQKKEGLERIGKTFKNAIFKKRETGLGLTIQTTEKGIFLIARKKFSVITGVGSYKEVQSVAGIFIDAQAKGIFDTAVRVFTNTKMVTEGNINAAIGEAMLAMELTKEHAPGIAACHGFIKYNLSLFSAQPIDRVAIIYTGYEGSLYDKLEEIQGDIPAQVKVSQDILGAMAYLHKKGYIHGDAKLANYLFRSKKIKMGQTTEIVVEAAVTDLGYTTKIEQGEPPGTFKAPAAGRYQNGDYGSGRAPPWFAGEKDYNGDPRIVESYIVGHDLWEIFYDTTILETLKISDAIIAKQKIDDNMRQAWATKIAEEIAAKRKNLPQIDPRNLSDTQLANMKRVTLMKLIMFELMDPHETPQNPDGTPTTNPDGTPKKHMTVIEANELLQKAARLNPAP